jgi:hypothetical protein
MRPQLFGGLSVLNISNSISDQFRELFMRFWIKLAAWGVSGYLIFCLLSLPLDYRALSKAETDFEQIASNMQTEMQMARNMSTESRARLEQAADARNLAFYQWNNDLKHLGMFS